MNIGDKLRSLRSRQLLTLQDLATKADLTKGYISQIENNQTSPSLRTLEVILNILGTNLTEFFANEKDSVVVFKKDSHILSEYPELKSISYNLLPKASHYIDLIECEIESFGQTNTFQKTRGDISCLCIEGQVILNYDEKRYIIKRGESCLFSGEKNFLFENKKDARAKVLIIITPPNIGGI